MDEDVLKKRKHAVSTAQQDHFEKAVVEFLRLARNVETKNGFTVTGPMLRLMALEEAKRIGIDNFQASDGWLTRVKERHGFSEQGRSLNKFSLRSPKMKINVFPLFIQTSTCVF